MAFTVMLYSFTCRVVDFSFRIIAICTEIPVFTSGPGVSWLDRDFKVGVWDRESSITWILHGDVLDLIASVE